MAYLSFNLHYRVIPCEAIIQYKTIGFILAKSIFEKGIKASFFFTKPFEQGFEKLPNELVDKFALDIDDLLDFTQ